LYKKTKRKEDIFEGDNDFYILKRGHTFGAQARCLFWCEHCHPFSPNTARGMGWHGPFSSGVPFGQGDTPIITIQRRREKKSISHLTRKIQFLNFDSNAMRNTT